MSSCGLTREQVLCLRKAGFEVIGETTESNILRNPEKTYCPDYYSVSLQGRPYSATEIKSLFKANPSSTSSNKAQGNSSSSTTTAAPEHVDKKTKLEIALAEEVRDLRIQDAEHITELQQQLTTTAEEEKFPLLVELKILERAASKTIDNEYKTIRDQVAKLKNLISSHASEFLQFRNISQALIDAQIPGLDRTTNPSLERFRYHLNSSETNLEDEKLAAEHGSKLIGIENQLKSLARTYDLVEVLGNWTPPRELLLFTTEVLQDCYFNPKLMAKNIRDFLYPDPNIDKRSRVMKESLTLIHTNFMKTISTPSINQEQSQELDSIIGEVANHIEQTRERIILTDGTTNPAHIITLCEMVSDRIRSSSLGIPIECAERADAIREFLESINTIYQQQA